MKAKTKKIVAKRFKITKTGIILHRTQNSRHLRRHKSKSQLRRYAVSHPVHPTMVKTIKSLLPYGS